MTDEDKFLEVILRKIRLYIQLIQKQQKSLKIIRLFKKKNILFKSERSTQITSNHLQKELFLTLFILIVLNQSKNKKNKIKKMLKEKLRKVLKKNRKKETKKKQEKQKQFKDCRDLVKRKKNVFVEKSYLAHVGYFVAMKTNAEALVGTTQPVPGSMQKKRKYKKLSSLVIFAREKKKMKKIVTLRIRRQEMLDQL